MTEPEQPFSPVEELMETAQKDTPIDENPSINITVSTDGPAANVPGLHKYYEVVKHSLRKDIKQALHENAKDGAANQVIAVVNALEAAKKQISGRKITVVHVRITGKRGGIAMLLHYPFRPTGE